MKKLLLLSACIFVLSTQVFAQILATYTGTGGTSTATVAVAANETVGTLQDIGFGTNTACTSGGLSGITVSTVWAAYSPAGHHVYFQILPNPGYTLTITNYWAWTRKSSTGPTLARLAYSLDGGTTWVSDMDHAQAGCSGSGCCGAYATLLNWLGATGPALTGITSTNGIIVGIFPFAPGASTGTFQVQYMEVDGTVDIASAIPVITTNPTNATICSGSNTSFTASATGTPTPTYQWQRSTTGIGGPWVNITTGMDGGIYGSSFTTTTLTLTGASLTENGYAYQMIATNTAGSATSTPALLTVTGAPTVASITGTTALCSTGTTTLADATLTGTWSSSNTAVATVSGTGVVSGVAAGTTTISYTVSNACGTTSVTTSVTVSSPAASIIGTTNICVSATSLLSNTIAGGTWSSSNPLIASIGATTGMVTGVAQGMATITYSVTNACGTTTATTIVTVNALAAAITGTTGICTGATSTLTNTTTGGTWSSSNTAIATVGSTTGVVTAIANGTAIITYTVSNICGTSTATTTVTVNTGAALITGITNICEASTTTLTNTTTGGTWSSSNPLIASVGILTGVVTGVAQGTATITYSVTNACGTTTATAIVTINAPVATIIGVTNICIGSTSTLTNITIGGIWSSSNTAIATVNAATGVVTGVANGNAIITYTVTNACGTSSATVAVAVYSSAGLIAGTSTICVGATTTLTNSTLGGIWISSNAAIATIGSGSGVVTGMAQGTTIITYIVTNTCGTTTATYPISVNSPATLVYGTDTICVGAFFIFTDSTLGGTWSTSNSHATVAVTGMVIGSSIGVDSIIYTVTNVCGTTTATKSIYIQALPNAGVIAGTNNLCQGMTTNLTNSIVGGMWSSSNITAAINIYGIVSSVYPGTDTILYTISNSCGTSIADKIINIIASITPSVTITTSPGLSLCPDIMATFTPAPTNGGTSPIFHWYVNGILTYTGTTYAYLPTNNDIVKCELISNATCALPDSNGTAVTMLVSQPVIPTVSFASSGGDTVCQGVMNTFTATSINGGTIPTIQWIVNWLPVATGNTFTYTPTNGDIVQCLLNSTAACVYPDTATYTKIMDVLPFHTPGVLVAANPGDNICDGNNVTITASPVNGGYAPKFYWTKNGVSYSNNTSFTYQPSTGDSLNCMMISNYHCVLPSDTANATVALTVNPVIIVTVTGSPSLLITEGAYDTLTAHVVNAGNNPTYQWYRNGMLMAGATFPTLIRNDFRNKDSLTCVVTTGNGTPCEGIKGFNWAIVEVGALGVNTSSVSNNNMMLIPNPNTGSFVIKGLVLGGENTIDLHITNVLGQEVYTHTIPVYNDNIQEQIKLSNNLPNGIYILEALNNNNTFIVRFSINR